MGKKKRTEFGLVVRGLSNMLDKGNYRAFVLFCKYLDSVSKHIYAYKNRAYMHLPFHSGNPDDPANFKVWFVTISWELPTVDKPIKPGDENIHIDCSKLFTFAIVDMSLYHTSRENMALNDRMIKHWPGIDTVIAKVDHMKHYHDYDDFHSSSSVVTTMTRVSHRRLLKEAVIADIQEEISRSTTFILHKLRGAITGKSFNI